MYRRRSFAFAACLVGLAIIGAAQAADPAHRPDPAKVTPTATFVQEAIVDNLFEVQSSKTAATKTFAKHMIDDHSAVVVKLAEVLDQAKQTRPCRQKER